MPNELLKELELNLLMAEERVSAEEIKEAKDAIQTYKIRKLIDGILAVQYLMEQSSGVAGLHLNGDLAPWNTLRTGGYFESWLSSFDDALEIANTF